MRVTLRLSDGLTSETGLLKVVNLGRAPFVVGRSPDADWPLTEPTHQVSGVHFELRAQGEDLLLTDLSSGGTAVGSSANRLQRGQPTKLDDQASLFLPVGSVLVTVERADKASRRLLDADDEGDFFELGEISRERGFDAPGPSRVNPASLLDNDPADDPLGRLAESRPRADSDQGGSKLLDPSDLLGGGGAPVAPPRAAPDPAPVPRALPPDDVPRAAPPPRAADLFAQDEEPGPRPAAPVKKTGASWLDDDDDDADLFGDAPTVEPGQEPEPASVAEQRTAPVPEDPQAETTTVPPVPASPPDTAAPPSGQAGAAEAALQALFTELGHPNDPGSEAAIALCAEIGRTYAAMADAMRQMLETRAEVKRALGIVATEIEIGANPLKTARDRTAAIDGLIRPLSSGFLSGEAAVEDTLHSMQAHQYAMVSGIKAALQKTLAEFDPEALERKLTKRGMTAWLPARRKAALWDSFTENYERFSEQASENFRVLIGRELDNLYHTQRSQHGARRRD